MSSLSVGGKRPQIGSCERNPSNFELLISFAVHHFVSIMGFIQTMLERYVSHLVCSRELHHANPLIVHRYKGKRTQSRYRAPFPHSRRQVRARQGHPIGMVDARPYLRPLRLPQIYRFTHFGSPPLDHFGSTSFSEPVGLVHFRFIQHR